MRPIRMIFISTNGITRGAIAQISKQSHLSIQLLDTFPDFHAAEPYLHEHTVQVILIEDSLPHHTTLLKEVRAISLKQLPTFVIVILQQPTVNMVLQLVSYGVRGILFKHDNLKIHLIQAIIMGKRRNFHLSPKVSQFMDGQRTLPVPLSPREYDVLKLLADGLEPKAIVFHIGLGKPTVYRIIRSLRVRFNAHNNAHLIAIAHQSKLLEPQRVD